MKKKVEYYYYKGCSTCTRVKSWLLGQHVDVTARDFFANRFSEDELRSLIGERPIRDYFSWVSPSFRKLGVSRESLDDDRLVSLMLDEPRLIRRPLIVVDDLLLQPMSGSDRIIQMLSSHL